VLDAKKIEGDYIEHFVMSVKIPRGTHCYVIFYFCGYFSKPRNLYDEWNDHMTFLAIKGIDEEDHFPILTI